MSSPTSSGSTTRACAVELRGVTGSFNLNQTVRGNGVEPVVYLTPNIFLPVVLSFSQVALAEMRMAITM